MSVVTLPTTYTIGSWSAVNNGQPSVDAFGCWWSATTETGWSGSSAARTNSIAREQADGDFDGPVFESGRLITLGGKVIAPDQMNLQKAMDRFDALLVAGSKFADLIVAEAHLTRQANVRRDGQKPVAKQSPFMGTWSIGLYAADPVKYSATVNHVSTGLFAGSNGITYPLAWPLAFGNLGNQGFATLHNAGNLNAFPVLTITNPTDPLVNPRVRRVGDSQIGLSLTIAPGDSLVIDTSNQTVLLNGSASRYTSVTADSAFWSCPPGDSQLLFTADSGINAVLDVAWRDPYA